jgi:hypothetical protein
MDGNGTVTRRLRSVAAPQLVDPATGEILEAPPCANCLQLEDQLAGAEKEIRSWRASYANLKRDREAEAQAHEKWGIAIALWHEWILATGHLKSRWSQDRFWLCAPFLEVDGFVICRWAVWGIAHEPNSKRLSSGLVEVYDSWELCFRNRGTFERYAVRGYFNPEARKLYSLRENGIGPDDDEIDPRKYFKLH